jgi:hypothetical protein
LGFESRAADVVSTIVDPETDHNTESDGELLQAYEGTSDFSSRRLGPYVSNVVRAYLRRSTLGIVHRNNYRQATDSNTTEIG